MQLAERFSDLPDYPFPRLRALLAGIAPGGPVIDMAIGSPRRPIPRIALEAIAAHGASFNAYPPNPGTDGLRAACAAWIARRYGVPAPDPETRILALNGSREGLFNAGLALIPEARASRPAVLIPNPFYQTYAAAAVAGGAEPVFVAAGPDGLPDYAALSPAVLARAALAYVCAPSNPGGAVADPAYWRRLLTLAETHDIRLVVDECYSELYRDTPPSGVLQAAVETGADPERVLVIQSLSKRSNAAGLRAGFACGGPRTIAALARLRAYGGAPLPLPIQHAAAALWQDEDHVAANRAAYNRNFARAARVLAEVPGHRTPAAGFFLWLPAADPPGLTRRLWRDRGVRVLPGAFLSRPVDGVDPGAGHIRVALVGAEDEIEAGLAAIADALSAEAA